MTACRDWTCPFEGAGQAQSRAGQVVPSVHLAEGVTTLVRGGAYDGAGGTTAEQVPSPHMRGGHTALQAVAGSAWGRKLAMTTDVAGLLRETHLLSSAPTADLRAVAAAARARTFRRGQIVFSADDPGDSLIVVVSGRVKMVVRSADGGELTLTIIQAGGVFGELSVADGGLRSADAETLEESELLIVPRAAILDICSRVPSVAQALTASLAAMLRRLTEATSDLVFLDLPRRVAKVLLSQPRDDDGVIRPGLSQEELARQAAGTRQSVNAALRGFERRGWITTQGRAVTVRQPATLTRFAGL